MRHRFSLRVYGYVVMPEHVHLLVSEPDRELLADAMHYLKLSFAKRLPGEVRARPRLASTERTRTWGTPCCLSTGNSFWQKRYHDRNVRDEREFTVKLRYLHRNPVKRGLVNEPQDWKWSSFRHYALRERGVVEIESEWTARDREVKVTGGPPRVFLRQS
jgi:putative transposase